MAQPLVSIIIPTFNRAHLIGETLDSVLAQTYTNWECIVVDDGSTDNTEEVLKNYCEIDTRFKYVHRPNTHKPGGNGARNYGFELSKGEYINWFDSDDLMLDDFIQKKITPFMEDEQLDVVISKYTYFDERGVKDRIANKNYSGDIINDLVTGDANLSTLPFLIKKSALSTIRFNEHLRKAQDLDFFFRFFTSLNRPKLFFVNQILHKVRKKTGDSISESKNNIIEKLVSKHHVNKMILNYFNSNNHLKGIEKYQKELLKDIVKFLENKKWLTALESIINCQNFTLVEKIKILVYSTVFMITNRGKNRILKV